MTDFVNIDVINGKGITQAILKKLQDEGHVGDGKNLSASVWSHIMEQVKADNVNNKHYTQGSDFKSNSNSTNHWQKNFVVQKNAVLKFTTDLWKQIVEIAKGNVTTTTTTTTTRDPVIQDDVDLQDDTISNENTSSETSSTRVGQNSDQEEVIPESNQSSDEGVNPNEEAPSQDNKTISKLPIELKGNNVELPPGAKVIKGDITNIDSATRKNKEAIIKFKDEDGKTVYRQMPNENNVSIDTAQRVVAKKQGKNVYYAVDATIPDGVEVSIEKIKGVRFDNDPMLKTHYYDNKEDVLVYSEEKDGEKFCYLMIKDDNTGLYTTGKEVSINNGIITYYNKQVDNKKQITSETQPIVTMSDKEIDDYLNNGNDKACKQLVERFNKLDQQLSILEQRYNIDRNAKGSNDALFKLNEEQYNEFDQIKEEYDLLARAMKNIKSRLKTWKDTTEQDDISKNFIYHNYRSIGSIKSPINNISLTHVKQETLPDGTKVYNSNGIYYDLFYNKLSEDDLASHNK